MNQTQTQRLKDLLENIKHNTGKLLEGDYPNDLLFTNLISRGSKVFISKDLTDQNLIDIASIGLCLLLQKENQNQLIKLKN